MNWIWNVDPLDPDDFKRIRSAAKETPLDVTAEGECWFHGDHGDYAATLTHCDCPDFTTRRAKLHKPCKHIIALGAALSLHDLSRQADIAELQLKIAQASGMYHLFRRPILTDVQYDQLKKSLAALHPEE